MNKSNIELEELTKKYQDFMDAIQESNPNVTIPKEAHRKLVAERLAFGFDSIYFRYAAVVDELARYKAKDPIDSERDPLKWANCQKMHFWHILEQLTGAHELEDSFLKDKDKDGKYGKYGA